MPTLTVKKLKRAALCVSPGCQDPAQVEFGFGEEDPIPLCWEHSVRDLTRTLVQQEAVIKNLAEQLVKLKKKKSSRLVKPRRMN